MRATRRWSSRSSTSSSPEGALAVSEFPGPGECRDAGNAPVPVVAGRTLRRRRDRLRVDPCPGSARTAGPAAVTRRVMVLHTVDGRQQCLDPARGHGGAAWAAGCAAYGPVGDRGPGRGVSCRAGHLLDGLGRPHARVAGAVRAAVPAHSVLRADGYARAARGRRPGAAGRDHGASLGRTPHGDRPPRGDLHGHVLALSRRRVAGAVPDTAHRVLFSLTP